MVSVVRGNLREADYNSVNSIVFGTKRHAPEVLSLTTFLLTFLHYIALCFFLSQETGIVRFLKDVGARFEQFIFLIAKAVASNVG